MFRNLQQALATASASSSKADAKTMSPTLRNDIYAALDQVRPWFVGATPPHAGDGVSYQSILAIVHKHFPDLNLGLESVGNVEAEVALVVAGITNMVLEMSKWDGIASGMTMRTWVDTLSDVHGRISQQSGRPGPSGNSRKERVGRGITRGINHLTDVSLMTKEFAARIQIISLLKSVHNKIHGAGTDEARQGEALWSSKFI